MSNKAPTCPNCGLERGVVSDEQIEEFQRRQLRDRIYRLKMGSYAAITLFLVAAGWYFFVVAEYGVIVSRAPLAVLALASLAYLVVRTLLFKAKRDMKRL